MEKNKTITGASHTAAPAGRMSATIASAASADETQGGHSTAMCDTNMGGSKTWTKLTRVNSSQLSQLESTRVKSVTLSKVTRKVKYSCSDFSECTCRQ